MTSSWFLRHGSLYAILHNGFWKGEPDFIFMFNCHFMSILNGLDTIRLCIMMAGISQLGGRNFEVFWAKWPQKRQMREKHLVGGHFFTPNCVFWAIVRFIISMRLAFAGAQEKQNAGRRHKKCLFHVCVERLLAAGFQLNIAHVFVSWTLSNVQHFIVITCEVSELWSVEVFMLP